MPERVLFSTEDGVEIVGLWNAPEHPKGAALLLHMMPTTKESWLTFADRLAKKGIASLAIDLRGHGESVKKGEETLDYRLFEDDEHFACRLDVKAALRWLSAVERFAPDRIVLSGASIGANLALWALAEEPNLKAALALSPGLNYRGLIPEEYLGKMPAGRPVLLAASEEDTYSSESMRELAKAKTAAALETMTQKGLGHGTTMFERDPSFMERAAAWLASKL